MKKITSIRWAFVLTILLLGAANAWSQENYFGGDLQMRGLLGGKLKIEMHLTSNGQQPFFQQNGQECFNAQATYYYRSQLKPISLSGRFCPSNHSFWLADQPNEEATERFEGTWDPKTRKMQGTWKMISTGKTMPFELSPVDAGVSTADIQKFYNYLTETCSGEPDAEGASIQSAQWTSQGGTIIGFQPQWSGDVYFLSPTRFEYSSGYNSTARSSYYTYTYQLVPAPNGPFLIQMETANFYDKMADEEGDEDSGSCSVFIAVLRYVDGSFEEVPTSQMPSSYDNSYDGSYGLACGAEIFSDAILTPSGNKIYWDGKAFVEK